MSLSEYRRKRDFRNTPEPGPSRRRSSDDALSFVVQHHLASHEHDDFRLELDGVLKSWAVPRRVSRKHGVRRLAVEVEDHPLEYGKFEGEIPKGQYGGGTVKIWDAGTWESEGDPHEGLERGKLVFTLNGDKMKGRWSLVRMRTDDSKPQWLLTRLSKSR
jgi:bifunctional non-homologous end joining protein LigD